VIIYPRETKKSTANTEVAIKLKITLPKLFLLRSLIQDAKLRTNGKANITEITNISELSLLNKKVASEIVGENILEMKLKLVLKSTDLKNTQDIKITKSR
jgi:hypothetical protein